jgi:hypothetical protein
MAATSTWLTAYDAQLLYATKQIPCSSLRFRESIETFETTNTESAGAHEFGVAVTTLNLSFSCPIASETKADLPAMGSLVDTVFSDSVDVYTGKARVTSRERQGGGKGGYVWNFEATFTGAVTRTAPA